MSGAPEEDCVRHQSGDDVGQATSAVERGAAKEGKGVGKKLRRKRKQLDALVPHSRTRRRESGSGLLRGSDDSEDVEYSNGSGRIPLGRRAGLGAVPLACGVVFLTLAVVGAAAALKLLMATRKDLDALHKRIDALESTGSQLPAKLHEWHTREQALRKNQSALWQNVQLLTNNLKAITDKVLSLKGKVDGLEGRVASASKLEALPRAVSDAQSSVATVGSELQDARSHITAVAERCDKLANDISDANGAIKRMHAQLEDVEKSTIVISQDNSSRSVPKSLGSSLDINQSGSETQFTSSRESVSVAVLKLRSSMVKLQTNAEEAQTTARQFNQKCVNDIQHLKRELFGSLANATLEASRGAAQNCDAKWDDFEHRFANLTQRVDRIDSDARKTDQRTLALNQSVSVVRGVERKLEGSQVQLASGVTDLRQQLDKLANEFRLPRVNETAPRQARDVSHVSHSESKISPKFLKNKENIPAKKRLRN